MKLSNGITVSLTPISTTKCGFGLISADCETVSMIAERKGQFWRIDRVINGELAVVGFSAMSLALLIEKCADALVRELDPLF